MGVITGRSFPGLGVNGTIQLPTRISAPRAGAFDERRLMTALPYTGWIICPGAASAPPVAQPAEALPRAAPVQKAEGVVEAPIEGNVKLERPLPTLPQQPKQGAGATQLGAGGTQRPAGAILQGAQPVQAAEEPKRNFASRGGRSIS